MSDDRDSAGGSVREPLRDAGLADRVQRRALLLGLVAVLFWSTAATAFKLSLRHLSVPQLLCIAICVSLLVLLIELVRRGRLAELLAALRQFPGHYLLMAALNPLLYYLVLLAAYDVLPAQQAQTINYTWAITLALLSMPILGQRLAARDWFAVAVGYLGVLIIATEGKPWTLHFTSLPGVALALASTVIWAVFWLMTTRSKDDPLIALSANFCLAAPLSVALVVLLGEPWPDSAGAYLSAVYVGLFEMGFTWLLWSAALRSAANVSRVGNLIFLSPILSLALIGSVLGETIHPATLIGLALILPGIFLQQRPQD